MNPLFAMSPAPQGGAQADPTQQLLSTGIMFGGIIFIFYFMMIRPQQKRQKEMQKLLDSIAKGDKVVTSSGIHGSVAEVNDEQKTVLLNIGEGVKVTFDKAAVVSVIKK